MTLVGFAIAVPTAVLTVLSRIGVWRGWLNPWYRNWMLERLVLLLATVLPWVFTVFLTIVPIPHRTSYIRDGRGRSPIVGRSGVERQRSACTRRL